MADSFIAIDEPVVVDKKLDTTQLVVGANTVERERVQIAGSAATAIAPVDATKGLAVDLTATGANTTALKVDGSAVTQPVSAASLPLPTGASTAAKQPALGTAGTASADVITVQGIALMTALKVDGSAVTQPVSISGNQAVNVAQINGVTPLMGNGVTGTGSPRVTIASDNTAFTVNAAQSGTWTVQPGNTANTTAWLASLRPGTSGGFSTFHLVSAATTNATNIKASAGQVFGWYIYNSNAAARKVAFHNASGTPTAGASIFFTIVIPPTSGANVFTDTGIAFSTGIAITTVTDLTDAGATAVAANDLIINIFYA